MIFWRMEMLAMLIWLLLLRHESMPGIHGIISKWGLAASQQLEFRFDILPQLLLMRKALQIGSVNLETQIKP